MSEDQSTERAIQAAGADKAPRITPADIEANIRTTCYFTAADAFKAPHLMDIAGDVPDPALHLLTFCVLVLKNGFTVTGESACASPENFNAEIGQRIARQNAVAKIWPLMGYELKCRLSNTPPDDGALTDADALSDLLGNPRPDHPTAGV